MKNPHTNLKHFDEFVRSQNRLFRGCCFLFLYWLSVVVCLNNQAIDSSISERSKILPVHRTGNFKKMLVRKRNCRSRPCKFRVNSRIQYLASSKFSWKFTLLSHTCISYYKGVSKFLYICREFIWSWNFPEFSGVNLKARDYHVYSNYGKLQACHDLMNMGDSRETMRNILHIIHNIKSICQSFAFLLSYVIKS